MAYNQGILLPAALQNQLPKTQFGLAQNWFVNRTPLTARFGKVPVGNISFIMVGYKFRPRTTRLTAPIGAGDTTLALADATILTNGDVLLLSTGEAVEIAAAPNTVTNAVTVRRGIGTMQVIAGGAFTPVAPTAIAGLGGGADLVTNLGNSRTGGEINQLAISQLPSQVTQWVQTYQHIVQVAGVTQDIQGWPLPPGIQGPWEKNKTDAAQNLMDDIEVSSLYGVGEALSPTNIRPKQYGICNLLTTNNHVATNPTSYRPTDLIADAIQPIRANGGRPTVLMVAPDFMTGLARWGMPAVLMSPGRTLFGIDIDVFYSPAVGPIPIVENMWLKPGSVLTLSGDEVRFRVMHDLDYQPYGRRGDTGPANNNGEGDWIARIAVELDNEAHHSYISGIQTYTPV